MAPVKKSTNGKGIMNLIEYTPLVYRPNEKAMVLWKTGFFEGVIWR